MCGSTGLPSVDVGLSLAVCCRHRLMECKIFLILLSTWPIQIGLNHAVNTLTYVCMFVSLGLALDN